MEYCRFFRTHEDKVVIGQRIGFQVQYAIMPGMPLDINSTPRKRTSREAAITRFVWRWLFKSNAKNNGSDVFAYGLSLHGSPNESRDLAINRIPGFKKAG